MKAYKLLLKLRLASLVSAIVGKTAKKKVSHITTALFAFLILFLVATMVMMFASVYILLCPALIESDNGWFTLASAFILALMLSFFGSIFSTKAQLFDARDTELLLSMPIPPMAILASRMTVLLLINLFFSSIVMLPASFVYFYYAGFSVGSLISCLIGIICSAILSLSVSAIFGWIIELIASRTPHKSIITVILFLGFFMLYMYVCMQLQELLNQLILVVDQLSEAASAIKPLYMLGLAGENGSILYALPLLGISILIFAIFCVVISKTFIMLSTTKRGVAKKSYDSSEIKASGVFKTLLHKEITRFFGSTTYLLNAGMGAIMQIILGIMMIGGGNIALEEIQIAELRDLLPAFAICIPCFIGSMVEITAPSVSLEGSSLWILRSLPLRASDILRAKLALHALVACPSTLFCAIAACIGLGISAPIIPFAIIIPTVFAVLTGEIGLIMNLRFPRFDWLSEAQPVKQGASVGLTMLLGMLSTMVLMIACIAGCIYKIAIPVFLLVTVIVSVIGLVLYKYICTKGAERFNRF